MAEEVRGEEVAVEVTGEEEGGVDGGVEVNMREELRDPWARVSSGRRSRR